MKEKKDYYVLADHQPVNTCVDKIREFLKWSVENGFKYRQRSLRDSVKKLQVKRGYIYCTSLYDGAPYYDVLYRNSRGVVHYRIWENDSYNKNVASRLLYAFKKYCIRMTYQGYEYSLRDVEGLL